jgi:hypothetical protein
MGVWRIEDEVELFESWGSSVASAAVELAGPRYFPCACLLFQAQGRDQDTAQRALMHCRLQGFLLTAAIRIDSVAIQPLLQLLRCPSVSESRRGPSRARSFNRLSNQAVAAAVQVKHEVVAALEHRPTIKLRLTAFLGVDPIRTSSTSVQGQQPRLG